MFIWPELQGHDIRWWMRTRPLAGLALGVLLLAAAPFAVRALRARAGNVTSEEPDLVKRTTRRPAGTSIVPPFSGLDLKHIAVDDEGGTAAMADGRTARLTVDPALQRAAIGLLERHQLAEAAIVAMDPATGEILAWASHSADGQDACKHAASPAASVFKIVTASALVENAGLDASTRECYAGGGEQRIVRSDLAVDPLRDRWCVTLGNAMGRSTNAVFARLALRDLAPKQLDDMARSLGFGEPVPFDVEVQKSEISVPEGDDLGFARTAAGFWNTTLSPLHAAWLSAMVARGGELPKPFIVREVKDKGGTVVYAAPAPSVVRRAVKPDTAAAVGQMMEHTVTEGTSFKAFHDGGGRAFLHGIGVAGKTGTLADPGGKRMYTWFTSFAPVHPGPGERQIALGVLVIDPPKWKVKANVVARELLEAYFYPNRALQAQARSNRAK